MAAMMVHPMLRMHPRSNISPMSIVPPTIIPAATSPLAAFRKSFARVAPVATASKVGRSSPEMAAIFLMLMVERQG